MKIAVLAGGIGGARFLRGVRAACPDDDITAVVNTGDDVTLHGLRICPDLDSVMYTLGRRPRQRPWLGSPGRDLADQGGADRATAPSRRWFQLGDLDIATHLVRTRMLDAGFSLSDVTAALCDALAARRVTRSRCPTTAARRT